MGAGFLYGAGVPEATRLSICFLNMGSLPEQRSLDGTRCLSCPSALSLSATWSTVLASGLRFEGCLAQELELLYEFGAAATSAEGETNLTQTEAGCD